MTNSSSGPFIPIGVGGPVFFGPTPCQIMAGYCMVARSEGRGPEMVGSEDRLSEAADVLDALSGALEAASVLVGKLAVEARRERADLSLQGSDAAG